MIIKNNNAYVLKNNLIFFKGDVYLAIYLIIGIQEQIVVFRVHYLFNITNKQADVYVLHKNLISLIINAFLVKFQTIGIKQLTNVKFVQLPLNMTHTKEVAFVQSLHPFCKMENVFLAVHPVIGTLRQVHALIAHKLIFSVASLKYVFALKRDLINITENAYLANFHIIGIKLPECVFLVRRHIN